MKRDLTDRVGVCSWSLHPGGARELLDRLAACGLRKVQLALNPLADEPKAWSGVGRMLEDAGVSCVSGMFGTAAEDYSTLDSIRQTGGFVIDSDWPENLAIARRALELGGELGIGVISTHVGFIPHDGRDPLYPKMLERIRAVADLFAERGATLLMETGQETADDLWAFLDALDRPNVAVNFDPANMILYDKGDPIASLRRLLPRVRQVHVKDAVRTKASGTWGRETPVGEGEVDWPAFLRVLDEGGFEGDLIVEREGGDRRVEEVRQAVEHLRSVARGALV